MDKQGARVRENLSGERVNEETHTRGRRGLSGVDLSPGIGLR